MGNFKLPEPVVLPAKTGAFECPNCGVYNKIDPAKTKNKFAYTDTKTEVPYYYPMQACEQCGIPHEIADHSMNEDNKFPDMILIPGVESAPFYYWEGSPLKSNFIM